jgi:two-component system CheB/CheR fusion protein
MTDPEQLLIHVVEDDAAVRDSLRVFLEDVAVYASARDFLDTFDPKRRGCLLLDAQLPAKGGSATEFRAA